VWAELVGDCCRRACEHCEWLWLNRQAAGIESRVAKIAFTGETTSRLIMQYASQN